MATRLDQQGRQILEQTLQAAATHRAKCRQTSYRGDRDACAAIADQAEAWVAGGGSRLLERSEAGDDDAHTRLMTTTNKILATVGTAWADISKGAMVQDLVDAIKADAKTAVTIGGLGLAVVAVGVGAAYLAITSAPARIASTVRR